MRSCVIYEGPEGGSQFNNCIILLIPKLHAIMRHLLGS